MNVVDWLLDSDPALRWQVLRDVVHAPEAKVAAERARVATEGWGAQLLALQAADGQWGGGTFTQDGTCTFNTLLLVRDLGLDPMSEASRTAIERVKAGVDWGEEWGHNSFFQGEVEPCINGRVLALGAYFNEPNAQLLTRLLGEQLADGGWNCEAPPSTRSSFHTTLCVLEGLLAYETATGPSPAVTGARLRGQEYLLDRNLLRARSTGRVIDDDWTLFSYPTYWHYDVLRGLDYLRSADAERDPRAEEAAQRVERKKREDGRWRLENRHRGAVHFEMETVREPSRWNTLRAMRALERWR